MYFRCIIGNNSIPILSTSVQRKVNKNQNYKIIMQKLSFAGWILKIVESFIFFYIFLKY